MVKFKEPEVVSKDVLVRDMQVGETMYGALDGQYISLTSLILDADDEVWVRLDGVVRPVVSREHRVQLTKLPLHYGFAVTAYGNVTPADLVRQNIIPQGSVLPLPGVGARYYIEERLVTKAKTFTWECEWPDEVKKKEEDKKKKARIVKREVFLGRLLTCVAGASIVYAIISRAIIL